MVRSKKIVLSKTLGTHHHFAGSAKFGESVIAFSSESTTYAAVGLAFNNDTEKSTTNKEGQTMMNTQEETQKNDSSSKYVAMIVAALVVVTGVEEQVADH